MRECDHHLNFKDSHSSCVTAGMAPKPKQQSQPSLAMLDQLRQAYNRGEHEQAFNREHQEQAEWNARVFSAATQHREDTPTEPSTIALLQQKFAQMERHKAEMQKPASQPQQVQIYPSQWSMSVQQNSMPPPPPVSSAAYPESRHFVPTTAGFYSFQQHQPPQVMAPSSLSEVPEQFYGIKQEISWRPPQDSRPTAGWTLGNAAPSEVANNAPLMYMTQQQQGQQQGQQFQAPKVVEYQPALQHQFAVPPQPSSFSSFQLNGPPAPPDVGSLGSVVVSSRCDKTGGHSVEIKNMPDHYKTDDSEMSLDNFSGRLGAHISQPPQVSSVPNAPQVLGISLPSDVSLHMLINWS